jgi:hypothetical protein
MSNTKLANFNNSATHAPVTAFNWRGQNVEVATSPTPGGGDILVSVTINDNVLRALRAVSPDFMRLGNYDYDPDRFETAALNILQRASPPFCKALEEAARIAPVAIAVSGLQVTDHAIPTPADGVVDSKASGVQTGILIGAAKAMGWSGFAYEVENGGMLFRGVCAVRKHHSSASSQGAADLNFHQDNVNMAIPRSDDRHPDPLPPMNSVQGFCAITTMADIPMRMTALEDVLAVMHGRSWDDHVSELFRPDFSIKAPDSHGPDAPPISGVPMLVRHTDGKVAGRYHLGNVNGQTDNARLAVEAFGASIQAAGEIQWVGQRGDLLFYRNTGILHRRQHYEPRYNATDRYYVRVYFDDSETIAHIEKTCNGRVFK